MTSYRTATTAAGVLFIVATGATMLSQILIGPTLESVNVAQQVGSERGLFSSAIFLEIVNAAASAGIAIALFPILRRCVEGLAVAYVGFRVIEASVGVVATIGLLLLLTPEAASDAALESIALAFHEWAFLLVLTVFSLSTVILYPLMLKFRLVPAVLSIWGLIGGLMLLASALLILFGRIEIGGTTDTVLSLPIWINEMALALWLIFRGVSLTQDKDTMSTARAAP